MGLFDLVGRVEGDGMGLRVVGGLVEDVYVVRGEC